MEDANPTSTGASLADIAAMTRAVELGELGRIGAPPNPWVGCVIIGADGVVGTGFHERPGEPHAEVRALAAAGPAARGATAVVTLEPCSHTGRTGPCADALIDRRIVRTELQHCVLYQSIPEWRRGTRQGDGRHPHDGRQSQGGSGCSRRLWQHRGREIVEQDRSSPPTVKVSWRPSLA